MAEKAIRRKVPGQPGPPASEWNAIRARIEALEKKLGGAQQTLTAAAAAPVPFRYKSSDGDVIVARLYIDAVEGTEDIYIAKPYTWRPSVTSRGGHTYTYTNDYERTDELASNIETQVLTPGFEVNDVVFAQLCPYYTDVTYDPLGGAALAPVEWLLMAEARTWAVKFGT